jgi:hypothetical protein
MSTAATAPTASAPFIPAPTSIPSDDTDCGHDDPNPQTLPCGEVLCDTCAHDHPEFCIPCAAALAH